MGTNNSCVLLFFARHKSWYSAVSLGRCSLFPSKVGLRTYQNAGRSRYSELEIDSWLLDCVAPSVCVIYTFIWFFTSYHEFFSCVRSWRLSDDEGPKSTFEFRITLASRHHTIATFSGPERSLNHKRDIKWDTFSDIYPVLPWSFWHVHCSDISKHNLVSRKRLEKKREITCW